MDKRLIGVSKFLSLVLRHQPEVIGLALDGEGWLQIDTLIEAANKHGKNLSLEVINEVVATNDKKRFALSDDGLRIRASQGHSISDIELNLKPLVPPDQLYHGTIDEFLPGIRKTGLDKRSRNHVHMSADEDTARAVGQRRGKPVILVIDSKAMHEAGYAFYRSANGVWLTDAVQTEFITFP